MARSVVDTVSSDQASHFGPPILAPKAGHLILILEVVAMSVLLRSPSDELCSGIASPQRASAWSYIALGWYLSVRAQTERGRVLAPSGESRGGCRRRLSPPGAGLREACSTRLTSPQHWNRKKGHTRP